MLMRTLQIMSPTAVEQLQEGQLWKLKRHYVYIVALMGSSIRFKLLDSPKETQGRVLTSGADTLFRYVISRNGRLVNC